ncbi:MAG TPA: hypothetical protein VHZ95_06970, partial [Polyangiales bacterium]|nr:hypothetical protein [Polyangiales bacterium]
MDAQTDAHISLDASTRKDSGEVDDAGPADASAHDASEPSDAAADSGMWSRTLSCPSGQTYGSPLPTDRG